MPIQRRQKRTKTAFIGHDYTVRGGRKTRFRKTVNDALQGTSYTPVYADTSPRRQHVLKDIMRKIKLSKLCVFDLTDYKKKKNKNGTNLNVLLELGICLSAGIPAYIAYKKNSIDFEKELSNLLGSYRYPYNNYGQFSKELQEFIITTGKRA